MTYRSALFTLALLAVAAPLAAGAAKQRTAEAGLPERGVLVPGQSLGGIRIGDPTSTVRSRWGSGYTLCSTCRGTTWLYVGSGRPGSGAAVTFRGGRVVAVFTLGVPRGWRTTRGIALGDPTESLLRTYGSLPWRRCLGYGALTLRHPGRVTSIYTFGEYVYGFALTHASEPVCQ